MSNLATAAPMTASRPEWHRIVLRWMVSFAGFPLGGFASIILTGPVDDLPRHLPEASSPARSSAPSRPGRWVPPVPAR